DLLANTIGGLAFVSVAYLIFNLRFGQTTNDRRGDSRRDNSALLSSRSSILAGIFKGTNSFLFVASTTFVAATQSLVYESTYVIWSLIFCVALLQQRTALGSSTLKALLILLGIAMVSGAFGSSALSKYPELGA